MENTFDCTTLSGAMEIECTVFDLVEELRSKKETHIKIKDENLKLTIEGNKVVVYFDQEGDEDNIVLELREADGGLIDISKANASMVDTMLSVLIKSIITQFKR